MKIIRRTAAFASTAIATAALFAIPITAAHAMPDDCSDVGFKGDGQLVAQVRCNSGPGQFRAIAVCDTYDNGTVFHESGAWVDPGGVATAYCPMNSKGLIDVGWDLRN